MLFGCAELSFTSACTVTDSEVIDYQVARDLGLDDLFVNPIPRAEVRKKCNNRSWFVDTLGCARSDEDFVNIDERLRGTLRVNVIAHEAFHRKDFETGAVTSEERASAYGYRVAAILCKEH